MRIRVTKSDGSIEDYLHTKVMKSFSNALDLTGQSDVAVAEELSEATTYFLHQRLDNSSVNSSEIYSMVQVALMATGFEQAAVQLHEYHIERQLKRNRIEVANISTEDLSCYEVNDFSWSVSGRCRWDKSRIITTLSDKYNLDRVMARAIAGQVEEKVLALGVKAVPLSLIKQLVFAEAMVMLDAESQLNGSSFKIKDSIPNASRAGMDVCLRQVQKGICEVGA